MKRRSLVQVLLLAPLSLIIRRLRAQSGPATYTDTVVSHPVAANTKKFELPVNPVDRNIDALGTESNIHSPADAETYINAILAKYKIETATIPSLRPLAHRLAIAEYAAISDPSKRIPEAQVADVFNRMMDEWGTAQWTRMTVEDFHRFHRMKAGILIPYSVSRDAEKNVADYCRPVEAVYLLFLLAIERGLQSGPKLPDLPENFAKGPMYGEFKDSSLRPFQMDAGVNRRDEEYRKARSAWLQGHTDPAQEIGMLLDALHIE
jgi:hypothetical protein